MAGIVTKAQREKLAPRREPYWLKLDQGGFLGFRRGPDTWIARYRDREKKQHYHALAGAEDYVSAKGLAEKWLEQMGSSARRAPKRGTVRAALAAYIADLKRHGRTDAAGKIEKRFKLTVDDEFGLLTLEDLTREDFEAWRDRLRTGREPRTVNRYVRGTVAALNAATKELGHVGNRTAWSVKTLQDDQERSPDTVVFLDSGHREALIGACAPNLAAFLRGLEHSGARPGELASATVADWNSKNGTVAVRSRKGKGAKLRGRMTQLSNAGIAFYKAQAKDKLPAAPLFPNADGGHWTKDQWTKAVRLARVEANKTREGVARIPEAATAYSFRHARISELLQIYAVDPLTVANQTGTSLQMMQLYYWRLVPSSLGDKLNPKPADAEGAKK